MLKDKNIISLQVCHSNSYSRVLSIFALTELVFMALFCAVIKIVSLSLYWFPFCSECPCLLVDNLNRSSLVICILLFLFPLLSSTFYCFSLYAYIVDSIISYCN